MKEMTQKIAYDFQVELEAARTKLDHVLTVYHHYSCTEWTGGPSGEPKNHKVPAPEIAEAFRHAKVALKALLDADSQLAIWIATDGVAFQRGSDKGAEWFQKMFAIEEIKLARSEEVSEDDPLTVSDGFVEDTTYLLQLYYEAKYPYHKDAQSYLVAMRKVYPETWFKLLPPGILKGLS